MLDADTLNETPPIEDQLSDQDKYRIHKMFEMMQVPVIKYMHYILQESTYGTPGEYADLFELPDTAELTNIPIVLQNIDELSDKYIHITFDIMEVDETRPTDYHSYIPNEELWKYVTSMVNDGANMIWNYYVDSIVKCPKNKEFLKSITLELNLDMLVFNPIVVSPHKQVEQILTNILDSITKYKSNVDKHTGISMYSILPEDKRQEIDSTEQRLIADIAKAQSEITEVELVRCATIQDKLRSLKLLVAQCSILDYTDLPEEMQNVIQKNNQ